MCFYFVFSSGGISYSTTFVFSAAPSPTSVATFSHHLRVPSSFYRHLLHVHMQQFSSVVVVVVSSYRQHGKSAASFATTRTRYLNPFLLSLTSTNAPFIVALASLLFNLRVVGMNNTIVFRTCKCPVYATNSRVKEMQTEAEEKNTKRHRRKEWGQLMVVKKTRNDPKRCFSSFVFQFIHSSAQSFFVRS